MNEHLRLEYLAALGIDMYMPRRQLPGARPSPVMAVQAPVSRSRVAVVERQQSPFRPADADSTGIHQLVDALVDDKSITRASAQPQAQQIEPALADTVTIRFVLNCWRVGPDLLVIDSHQPGRGFPTEALLCNILRAIGLPARLPPVETLRWPVIRQASARLDDAREMVAGFLAGHMHARPATTVWLMGEAALRVCTDLDEPLDTCLGKTFRLPGMAVPALALPCLLDMLVNPRLKAITWHTIRRHHVSA